MTGLEQAKTRGNELTNPIGRSPKEIEREVLPALHFSVSIRDLGSQPNRWRGANDPEGWGFKRCVADAV